VQGRPAAPRKPAAAAGVEVADAGAALPPPVDFQEAEFGESERSRDPFRSYAQMFAAEARTGVRSQREVVLDQYSIDELRLIGIITRIHPAKAMLVDPTGVGHVVQRGQFVGRPEVVQAGTLGGTGQEINWRIDRIREGDVVLVREDPKNPDVPSATRVIPLRPETTETGG
jgi:type IV pilus assembly protein PilP